MKRKINHKKKYLYKLISAAYVITIFKIPDGWQIFTKVRVRKIEKEKNAA